MRHVSSLCLASQNELKPPPPNRKRGLGLEFGAPRVPTVACEQRGGRGIKNIVLDIFQ